MFIFTHATNQNSPPGFYHYTLGIIITHSSQTAFSKIFLQKKKKGGEDYEVEKITKI